MGQAVDLEAPVLTIDSHENLDYVGATINLSGSCTDNVGVSRIEVVNVSTVGPDAGAVYGGVSISGNEWSVTLLNLS
jgi:tetrahydromethanopterin S-methyltransferase subunit A